MKSFNDYATNLIYQFGKFIRGIEEYHGGNKCKIFEARIDDKNIYITYDPMGKGCPHWIIKLEQIDG